MRRDSVRGLTTAAIVWLTAAMGMACGAGLPVLALAVTAGHFLVVLGFPYVAERLPRSRWTPSHLQVSYRDGKEALRDVLVRCTQQSFTIGSLDVQRSGAPGLAEQGGIATVVLEVRGVGSVAKLAAKLAEIDGVVSVRAGEVDDPAEQ
ncbi:MAG TPA: MgtC/SapB family protein [Steroidobacteraceae bacterium]|nr:MgtC/SapB family protein [Steroidobacteraceae bacterium]